ncbi:MAG: energy transducer TonB, partial [Proteobacteria bacterium]|nr:energy transducer TonB [Pseudomonadota bacterium]
MSTKNLFHSGPERPVQSPPLLLFLALSVLVHALAYFIVLNSGALESLLFRSADSQKSAPIEIEMVAVPAAKETIKEERWVPVIELPSTVKSNAPEKSEVIRYADRTVSVKRESVPKPDSRTSMPEGPLERAGEKAQRAQRERAERQKKSNAREGRSGNGGETTHRAAKEGTGIVKVSKEAVVVPPHMRSTETGGESGKTATKSALNKDEATGKGRKPSLFPSSERLAALAKTGPSTAARGAPGPILQLNTTELIYQKYLLYVRDRVGFFWEYPIAAAMNGWQGKLTVDFVIARDGKITEVTIDRSSGYPVLDDAAITAIKLAGPFFTFPENFVLNSFNVKYQFEYRLTNA